MPIKGGPEKVGVEPGDPVTIPRGLRHFGVCHRSRERMSLSRKLFHRGWLAEKEASSIDEKGE